MSANDNDNDETKVVPVDINELFGLLSTPCPHCAVTQLFKLYSPIHADENMHFFTKLHRECMDYFDDDKTFTARLYARAVAAVAGELIGSLTKDSRSRVKLLTEAAHVMNANATGRTPHNLVEFDKAFAAREKAITAKIEAGMREAKTNG